MAHRDQLIDFAGQPLFGTQKRSLLIDLRSLHRARAYIGEFGLSGYSQVITSSLCDRLCERWMGVDTLPGPLNPADGEVDDDQISYVPTPYLTLISVFRAAGVGKHSHLVDYGCGAGRALLVAAALGAASGTGIELQPRLVEQARLNLAAFKASNDGPFQVLQANAASYSLPTATNLLFFFKPFVGETLQAVVKNISSAVSGRGQHLTIVYLNDAEFRPLAAREGWRERKRGVALSRTRWPVPWAIYETPEG